jgi:hypothetical protein
MNKASINKPREVRKKQAITANWANGLSRSVNKLAKRNSPQESFGFSLLQTPSPFYPTLRKGEDGLLELVMQKGYVVARRNQYGEDAVEHILPSDIPGDPDPFVDFLIVEEGDKIYCLINTDVNGVATDAAIESAETWPESIATDLAGADSEGEEGTYYVRLCEIVNEDDVDKVLVLHTGHIDHFQPELVDNTSNSPSSNEARILKEWDAAEGKWKLRYIEGTGGITVTEGTDKITIDGSGSGGETINHPWKTTYEGEVEDVGQWEVIGDDVYIQNTAIAVATTTVAGDAGFVYLKIERDSATRAGIDATIEFDTTMPTSDEQYQYRAIAAVDKTATPPVFQLQFEEIRIFEELIVENGAMKLQAYEMSHRNNYDLP